VAIEPIDKIIPGISISVERRFLLLNYLFMNYQQSTVSNLYPLMEVPGIRRLCNFLKLEHHLHSTFEKGIIERTIQYIKDRTEGFDHYFPCRKYNCKLEHVINWVNLFVYMHNKVIVENIVN
jgi:putative transposase